MKHSKILTKPFLIKEYIKSEKSALKIAIQIRCSITPIYNFLRKYNIKIRNCKEASNLFSKKGKKANRYIDGRTRKQYFCKECRKKISISSGAYGSGLCKSCVHKGNKAYNYIDGRWSKPYYCIDCGIKISYRSKRCPKCQRKINSINQKERLKDPTNHPNWQGGIGKENYPFEFNNRLKESIRIRDNYTCQICGSLEKYYYRDLDIHHKDYNKRNINPKNLISLCQSCHVSTNFNREIYIEYFEILKNIIYK